MQLNMCWFNPETLCKLPLGEFLGEQLGLTSLYASNTNTRQHNPHFCIAFVEHFGCYLSCVGYVCYIVCFVLCVLSMLSGYVVYCVCVFRFLVSFRRAGTLWDWRVFPCRSARQCSGGVRSWLFSRVHSLIAPPKLCAPPPKRFWCLLAADISLRSVLFPLVTDIKFKFAHAVRVVVV